MLSINFSSESNNSEYLDSVREYSGIWASDGELIVNTWEKVTGLKFEETSIDATISNNISKSHPLNLRFSYDSNQKKSILIHELGHRILYNKVKDAEKIDSVTRHKILNLILWKVWLEVYNQKFVDEAIEFEKGLTEGYKSAWDWALTFPEDDRISLFCRILESGTSIISE